MAHIEDSRSVRGVQFRVTELVQEPYGRPWPARPAVLFRTIELTTNWPLDRLLAKVDAFNYVRNGAHAPRIYLCNESELCFISSTRRLRTSPSTRSQQVDFVQLPAGGETFPQSSAP